MTIFYARLLTSLGGHKGICGAPYIELPDFVSHALGAFSIVIVGASPVFGSILVRTYFTEGSPRPWLFWPSLFFILSPGLFAMLLFILSFFL